MWKLSILINQTTTKKKVGGFSETWYFDGTETQARSALIAISPLRAAMLTQSASIVGWRLAEMGQGAFILRAEYPGQLVNACDIPQMALNCVVYTPGKLSKKIFQLRGIADSFVVGGDYTPSQLMTDATTAYGRGLQANNLKFQAIDRAQAQVRVISISEAGVFKLEAGAVFAEGDFLQLLRCKNVDGKRASGKFRVATRVDAQNGTFQAWHGGAVANSGKARKVAYVFLPISDSLINTRDITTRKVGRPFFQYHGRRRAA